MILGKVEKVGGGSGSGEQFLSWEDLGDFRSLLPGVINLQVLAFVHLLDIQGIAKDCID